MQLSENTFDRAALIGLSVWALAIFVLIPEWRQWSLNHFILGVKYAGIGLEKILDAWDQRMSVILFGAVGGLATGLAWAGWRYLKSNYP